jgi:hypothetical protein
LGKLFCVCSFADAGGACDYDVGVFARHGWWAGQVSRRGVRVEDCFRQVGDWTGKVIGVWAIGRSSD